MTGFDEQGSQKESNSVRGSLGLKIPRAWVLLIAVGVWAFFGTAKTSKALLFVLPMTGGQDSFQINTEIKPAQVAAAKASQEIIAVHVEVWDVLDHGVVQSGHEAPLSELIGQFDVAARRQNIGLIAHNHLSGGKFFRLWPGMLVRATLADGSSQLFEIYSLSSYQASNPNDYSQPFVDLATGDSLRPIELFDRAYRPNELTFQTCIEVDGVPTWGVFFAHAKAFEILD